MANTLGVCILYSTALILKFLNADEKIIAADTPGIVNWTAKLNPPKHFRDLFTLQRS